MVCVPFQGALETCLDSPLLASLSVHGLHFTVYAPSTNHGQVPDLRRSQRDFSEVQGASKGVLQKGPSQKSFSNHRPERRESPFAQPIVLLKLALSQKILETQGEERSSATVFGVLPHTNHFC